MDVHGVWLLKLFQTQYGRDLRFSLASCKGLIPEAKKYCCFVTSFMVYDQLSWETRELLSEAAPRSDCYLQIVCLPFLVSVMG
jgi:hypothetical protein